MTPLASCTFSCFSPLKGLFLTAQLLQVGKVSSERMFGQYLSPFNIYNEGDEVPLWILPLTSEMKETNYDTSLFCDKQMEGYSPKEPPSRWIVGNSQIIPGPFNIRMLHNVNCEVLCTKTLEFESSLKMKNLILKNYKNNFLIDNGLPGAFIVVDDYGQRQIHRGGGFPVGKVEPRFISSQGSEYMDLQIFVNNHLKIFVDYYYDDNNNYHVIGFSVEPQSIAHEVVASSSEENTNSDFLTSRKLITCPKLRKDSVKAQVLRPTQTIIYTYDVIWRASGRKWASRWDIYLNEDYLVPDKLHTYSIMNGVFLVVAISVCLIILWVKHLKMLAKKNPNTTDVESMNCLKKVLCMRYTDEGLQKMRLLRGDVFRPPSFSPISLAVACGTGAQLLSSGLVFCMLCIVGLSTPMYKETLFFGAVSSYYLVGSWVGGFFMSKAYQELQIEKSKETKRRATAATAIFFPGVIFLYTLIVTIWGNSQLYPKFLLSFLAWLGIFVPLTFQGARSGFDRRIAAIPVDIEDEPRDIPKLKCSKKLVTSLSFLASGSAPAQLLFIENFFLAIYMNHGQYFDSFGYLFAVIVVSMAISGLCGILSTFLLLTHENHRWWWTAFLVGAVNGAWVYLQYYTTTSFETAYYDSALYHGQACLIALGYSMVFGFVNFFSSLYFIRALYSRVASSD